MGKGVDRQSFAIYREGGVRRGSLAFLNFLGVPYQQNYILIELRNAIFIHTKKSPTTVLLVYKSNK